MVNCNSCNIEFLKQKNQIEKTKNNFCSIKCCLNHNNKIRLAKAVDRTKQYNKNPKKCVCCNINLKHSKRRNRFCSTKCSATEN